MERVEGEDQADRAGNARENSAGIRELEIEAVKTEDHQDVSDIGIADDLEQPVPESHRDLLDPGARGLERFFADDEIDGPAVYVPDQGVDVGSDQSYYAFLERLGLGSLDAIPLGLL